MPYQRGYKALEIETEKQTDHERERREKEIRTLWTKFLFSAIFTIPLFYISMGHMVGLPLPGFLMPEMHPVNFALAQFVLTIPVIIAGYRFYTVGFSRLVKGEPNMDSLIAIGTSAALYMGYAIVQILNGNTGNMNLYFESAGILSL